MLLNYMRYNCYVLKNGWRKNILRKEIVIGYKINRIRKRRRLPPKYFKLCYYERT